MHSSQFKLARNLLGMTQTQLAEKLGWSTKRNVVNVETNKKVIQQQTALAIECLLRRDKKYKEFKMLNKIEKEIKAALELQSKDIKKADFTREEA